MLEMCKYQLLRFYQLDNESAELYVQARFQTIEEAKSILVNDALDYRG